MQISLLASELAKLLVEHPVVSRNPEFEKFFFELQTKVELSTGLMDLHDDDVRQIQQFAFDHGNARWKNELLAIFARTLGADLDGCPVAEPVGDEGLENVETFSWRPKRRARLENAREFKPSRAFSSSVAR